MGVFGLWQLLAPVGQPVTLESLENKVFAVDISIWLNQALKGYRDSQGGSVPNAHLLSLFSRLCKLLFYKIRPVIVFDGGYPELKKQTIINRQQRRAAVKQRSRDVGLKILTNYLASQNLAKAGGSESSSKQIIKSKEKVRDEIFKLPPIPVRDTSMDGGYETSDTADLIEWKFTDFSKEDIKYLNQIDINSEDFDNLPPDVKQEILSTLKESRKHRTWDQYAELPEASNEFSSYQMQCLLKKRNLSKKLEEVQKDLRKINSANFVAQYTNDHVIGETNKIMSDDCSHYVLLKKIMNKKEGEVLDKLEKEALNSSMIDTKNAFIKDMENIDILEIKDSEVITKNENKSSVFNTNSIIIKQELDTDEFEEDVDDPGKFQLLNNQEPSSNIESSVIETSLSNNDMDEFEEDVDDPEKFPLLNNQESSSNIESSLIETSLSNKNIVSLEMKSSSDEIKIKSSDLFKKNNATRENESVLAEINTTMKLDIISKNSSACDNEFNKMTTETKEKSSSLENEKLKVLCSKETNFSPTSSSPIESTSLSYSESEKIFNDNDEFQNDNSSDDEFIPCDETQNNFAEVTFFEKTNQVQSIKEITVIKEHSLSSSAALNSNEISSDISNLENLPNTEEINIDSKYLSASEVPSTSSDNKQSEKEREVVLQQLQDDLESATNILEADQAKQDRQNRTVQEHMVEECKELLQLFGIPYIVSPTEAEAQCAFFDIAGLTHGTITDDSDVWLFGGKKVYKNFFTQQKYVELYKDSEVFHHFNLSRKKLINFAMLTGSDYTEGIEGVGRVTAMEILSEFPGEGIEALQNFKEWWSDVNKNIRSPENKVRAKLKKLVLEWNFPDEKICDAYLNPVIDKSTEKFSWGRPDLDSLRDYTKERFGWNKSKVDDALLPVIKRLNERESQTHIDNFFTVNLQKQGELFPSKRIMSALKKMASPQKRDSQDEYLSSPNKKSKVSKKTAPKKPKRKIPIKRQKSRSKVQQGPMLSEESSEGD